MQLWKAQKCAERGQVSEKNCLGKRWSGYLQNKFCCGVLSASQNVCLLKPHHSYFFLWLKVNLGGSTRTTVIFHAASHIMERTLLDCGYCKSNDTCGSEKSTSRKSFCLCWYIHFNFCCHIWSLFNLAEPGHCNAVGSQPNLCVIHFVISSSFVKANTTPTCAFERKTWGQLHVCWQDAQLKQVKNPRNALWTANPWSHSASELNKLCQFNQFALLTQRDNAKYRCTTLHRSHFFQKNGIADINRSVFLVHACALEIRALYFWRRRWFQQNFLWKGLSCLPWSCRCYAFQEMNLALEALITQGRWATLTANCSSEVNAISWCDAKCARVLMLSLPFTTAGIKCNLNALGWVRTYWGTGPEIETRRAFLMFVARSWEHERQMVSLLPLRVHNPFCDIFIWSWKNKSVDFPLIVSSRSKFVSMEGSLKWCCVPFQTVWNVRKPDALANRGWQHNSSLLVVSAFSKAHVNIP